MKKKKFSEYIIFILWVATIVIYPALISIYVSLPLFIGFSGLMFIIGLEKKKSSVWFLALAYMFILEINLSLPIGLIAIASLICYIYIFSKLAILKHCPKCIQIIGVISINIIYLFMLSFIDLITSQSSIDYNISIFYTIIVDIIAVVLI